MVCRKNINQTLGGVNYLQLALSKKEIESITRRLKICLQTFPPSFPVFCNIHTSWTFH